MSEFINTPEELDALPDFTVVVAKPQEVDGRLITTAVQKLDGVWLTIGVPVPFGPEDINAAFFPGVVVFRL